MRKFIAQDSFNVNLKHRASRYFLLYKIGCVACSWETALRTHAQLILGMNFEAFEFEKFVFKVGHRIIGGKRVRGDVKRRCRQAKRGGEILQGDSNSRLLIGRESVRFLLDHV